MKKDLIKIFIVEIYSRPSMKNYETNEINYNHIYEIWSIDLADLLVYKISKNKGFRFIFILIDNLSKYLRAIQLKTKNSQTITDEISNVPTKSEEKPLKVEIDR